MSDGEPIDLRGHRRAQNGAKAGNTQHHQAKAKPVTAFNRYELGNILNVYGRRVAEGEWRDYAIDALSDRAVFSIFRNASEVPLYRIEKRPALARRQGAYSVITPTGLILKRGHELTNVLRVLEKKPKLVQV